MTNNRFKLTEEIVSTAEKGMNDIMNMNIRLEFKDISSFEFPLDEPLDYK